MTSRSFAEIFSEALDAHGLSPGQAAESLKRDGYKIDRGTLTRWRNGQTTPSLNKRDVIGRVPHAAGMTPAEEAEFIRAAADALGFEVRPRRPRPRPAAVIPQRIHLGADVLPPFAGRAKELTQLQHLVIQKHSVLITGLAGVGKTRLAQEVLRSCVGHFTHGCEFLTITSGLSSDRILRNVARLLNIEIGPGESTVKQRRLTLRRMREQLHGIDLLFLLDNVENADQVRELVQELPAITWIITARRISLKRIGVHPVHLDLPTPEDAAAIFQAHISHGHVGQTPAQRDGESPGLGPQERALQGRISRAPDTGQPFDPQLTAASVELAGRLPIAIRLLTGLIVSGTITTAAELRAWMDGSGLLRSGLHARKMRRFFDQMLESVPPESRPVLEACGIFATRGIHTANLIGVCRRAGIRVSPLALEGLADFSLIDYPDESRIELHPLVHEYARDRLRAGSNYELVREAFKDHYLEVARAVSEAATDSERDYRKLARMESNLLKTARAFHETSDWERLKAIWPALSGYLWNTGNYSDYEAFDRRCLDAARATGDTDWEAILLSELGFVAMETGAWDEADALYLRSQALHDAADDQIIPQARLRRYRAALATKRGALDEAADLLAECGRLLATLGDPPEKNATIARLLFHSATMSVHFRRGDLAQAEAAGMAADELFHELNTGGSGHRVGEYRLELGDVSYKLGKVEAARRAWEGLLSSVAMTLSLAEHAEAQLRLAWYHAQGDAAELAARMTEEASQTFLRHGRIERYETADDLLARIEGGLSLPSFDELVDGNRYPGY